MLFLHCCKMVVDAKIDALGGFSCQLKIARQPQVRLKAIEELVRERLRSVSSWPRFVEDGGEILRSGRNDKLLTDENGVR